MYIDLGRLESKLYLLHYSMELLFVCFLFVIVQYWLHISHDFARILF